MIDTNPWAGLRPMASRDACWTRLSDAHGIGGRTLQRGFYRLGRQDAPPQKFYLSPPTIAHRRLNGRRGGGFIRRENGENVARGSRTVFQFRQARMKYCERSFDGKWFSFLLLWPKFSLSLSLFSLSSRSSLAHTLFHSRSRIDLVYIC